ncbi:hypothetical protein H4R35_002569 [Dimargaris xerosporica]|nr:hypothetical protein H4R35_002569 [Dimargaris xerosporica]
MDRGAAVSILDRDLDGQGRVCIQVKWSSGIISWEPLSAAANFFHLLEDFEQRCIQERNHKHQTHASATTRQPAALNGPLVRSQSVRCNLDICSTQPGKLSTATSCASPPTPALPSLKQSLPLDTRRSQRGASLSSSALALITRPSTPSPLRPRRRGVPQHAPHLCMLRESASSPDLKALASSKRAPSFDHKSASPGGWHDSGIPQAAEKTNAPRAAPLPKSLFSVQAGAAADQAPQLCLLYSEIMFDFALPLADIMYPFHPLLREKDWDQFQILREESLASVLALTRSLSQLEDKYRDSVHRLQSQFIGHCSILAALPSESEPGPCSPYLETFTAVEGISAQELSEWLACFRSSATILNTGSSSDKPTGEASHVCVEEAAVLPRPTLDPVHLDDIKANLLTLCDRVKLRECQLQIVVHLLYLRLYRLKFKGQRDQTKLAPDATGPSSNPATAPAPSDDDCKREIYRATARQLAESLVFYIDKICIWSMVGFHTDLFTNIPGAKVPTPSPGSSQPSPSAPQPASTLPWTDPAQTFMESLIVPLFSRDLPDVLKPFRRQCSGTEILTPVHRSRSVLTSPRASRRASSGSLGRLPRTPALSLFRSRSRTGLGPCGSSTGTSPEIIGSGKSKRLLRKPSFVSSYDLRPRENGRVAADTAQSAGSPALGAKQQQEQRTNRRESSSQQGTSSPLALNPIGSDPKANAVPQSTAALRRMARMFARSPMRSPSKHPASSGRTAGGNRITRQLHLDQTSNVDTTETHDIEQVAPAVTSRSSTSSLPKSLLNKRVVAIPHSVAGKRSLRTVTHKADKRKQSAAQSKGAGRSLLRPSTYLSGIKRKRGITPVSPKGKRSAVGLRGSPKGSSNGTSTSKATGSSSQPVHTLLPSTELNPNPTPDPMPQTKAHPFIRTIRQLTNQTGLFGIRKPPSSRVVEPNYAADENPQAMSGSDNLDTGVNPKPADALPILQSPTGISVAVAPHQPLCSDGDAEVVMAPGAHLATRLQRQGSVRRRLDFFL